MGRATAQTQQKLSVVPSGAFLCSILAFQMVNQSIGISRSTRVLMDWMVPDRDRFDLKNNRLSLLFLDKRAFRRIARFRNVIGASKKTTGYHTEWTRAMDVYANPAQSYYGAIRCVPTLDPGLAFRTVKPSVGISRSTRFLEALTVPDPDQPN